MLLGDGFLEENQCLSRAFQLPQLPFSAKLNGGQKDPPECLSELARWREAEDHTI